VPTWLSPVTKIVGGAKARRPIQWQVSIRKSSNGLTHFCGGIVLNANTILSARHCFVDGQPGGAKVVAGARSLRSNRRAQVNILAH